MSQLFNQFLVSLHEINNLIHRIACFLNQENYLPVAVNIIVVILWILMVSMPCISIFYWFLRLLIVGFASLQSIKIIEKKITTRYVGNIVFWLVFFSEFWFDSILWFIPFYPFLKIVSFFTLSRSNFLVCNDICLDICSRADWKLHPRLNSQHPLKVKLPLVKNCVDVTKCKPLISNKKHLNNSTRSMNKIREKETKSIEMNHKLDNFELKIAKSKEKKEIRTAKYAHGIEGNSQKTSTTNSPSKNVLNNAVAEAIEKIKQEPKIKQKVNDFLDESKIKKKNSKTKYMSLNKKEILNRQKQEKVAKEYTKKILNEPPSGDANNKDTVLHVLSSLSGGNCLFYDSSKGINCDNSINSLMNLKVSNPEKINPEFCLTLDELINKNEIKDDNELIEETIMVQLKECIQQKKENSVLTNFKKKLAIAHNVNEKKIIIKDVFAGSANIIYVIDLTDDEKKKYYMDQKKSTVALEAKMKKLFDGYKSIGIHALLFRDSYDISMFDDKGNKTFGSGDSFDVGPPGRQKKYIQPAGWVRYGLKVLGKYGDDKWLHPFQDPGNWYRAYHGTGNAGTYGYNSVDAMSNIVTGGFYAAKVAAYGPGVYCSPNPVWLGNSGYVTNGIQEINTKNGKKKYKFMLQCCVNPDSVTFGTADIWVANTVGDIRAYGILIKEV